MIRERVQTELRICKQADTSTMKWTIRNSSRLSRWLLVGAVTLTTVALNSSTIKAQTSETIAQTGQVAPDGNGTFGILATPIINASGQVMFQSILNDTSGGSADDRAVYRWNNSGIAQLVRKGQSVPDGNGTFDIFLFPTFNDIGQVAFRGNLLGTSGTPFDAAGRGLALASDLRYLAVGGPKNAPGLHGTVVGQCNGQLFTGQVFAAGNGPQSVTTGDFNATA